MVWKTLNENFIYDFKKSWPCHGLPDDMVSISCEFASNGDLIDFEVKDSQGNTLDSQDFDGPALLALTQDCQKFGEIVA
jgi:hypothetical protein